MQKKKCSKCGKEKFLFGFYKCSRAKSGYKSACKECEREYAQANKEKRKETYNAWYEKNKEKRKGQYKEYFQEHKKELIEYNRQYRKTHKEQINKNERERVARNPEIKEYRRRYYEENKERIQVQKNEYKKKLRDVDSNFRLKDNLSSSVRTALCGRKGGIGVEKVIGQKIEDIKKHLENQFDETMSWDNYGAPSISKYTWNIDHVIAISYYNFFNPEEIKKCWNPRNLRPLSAMENSIRKNKFDITLIEELDIFDLLPEYLPDDLPEDVQYQIDRWKIDKNEKKK